MKCYLLRYQVLLNDWLADHIKGVSEMYDISFSETIRGALCLAYLDLIAKGHPPYKPRIEELYKRALLKKGNYEKVGREQFHKDLSKLYFEAHKAIEFFWKKNK